MPKLQLEMDSNRNWPIEMMSKHFSKTTNVFLFERASREYFTRLNRSSVEGVMTHLRKSCIEERQLHRKHLDVRFMT